MIKLMVAIISTLGYHIVMNKHATMLLVPCPFSLTYAVLSVSISVIQMSLSHSHSSGKWWRHVPCRDDNRLILLAVKTVHQLKSMYPVGEFEMMIILAFEQSLMLGKYILINLPSSVEHK